jgi:raffinose/stachyose/melibiose transport system substrate-binding protein
MKNALTTAGALALGASLWAGAASAQEVKVWVLSFANESANRAWDKIVADFEAANPDIDVQIETRGVDEHKSALRVAAGSDQGPDVYFMWAGLGLGGEFVNAGLSLPLDDAYAQNGWDDRFVATAVGPSNAYEGGRHGVPYTFHGMALYYNKALFEQAGITEEPETYEALKAAAQALKDAGIPAMTFGGSVNWHLMRLMDSLLETTCGAETADQLMNLEADWAATPCATEAFVELHDWTTNYILSPFMGIDQAQSFNLFVADRAAMMLEGDWLVGQLTDVGRADDFGVFVFPTGTDRLYSFAEYLYVSSKSPNAEAALKFLDFMASDAVQQEHLGAFAAISVNQNIRYDDVTPLEQEWIDIFATHPGTYAPADQAFPLDVNTEFWRVINEVASDNLAPEEAAGAMQTFIANRG